MEKYPQYNTKLKTGQSIITKVTKITKTFRAFISKC